MPDTDLERLAEAAGRVFARHCVVASESTQEQVAEQLGIGNEAVSNMELHLLMPTLARLVELAEIFQCETADLLTETSSHTSDQAKYVGTPAGEASQP